MQMHYAVITPKSREQWNTELHPQIMEEEWNFCCAQLEQLSLNYKLCLIHFKFLNQYYRTPVQLFRMGLRPTAECWKCHTDHASFLHMVWNCPQIAAFWSDVFVTISNILTIDIQPTAKVGLLGYVKEVPVGVCKLLAMLLLLAKRRIAMTWGRSRLPLFKDWITDITFCQEQLVAFWELMPVASRSKGIWRRFVAWLQSTTDEPDEAMAVANI